jgi:SAM-dependent methyltransferase
MTGPRRTLPPRQAAALEMAAAGARLLYQAGARQVWICGSLAHGQHWDEMSDLDYVTTGVPTSRRAALTAALIQECGRNVDVIPLEDAPSFLRVQIMQAMIPVNRFGRTAEITYGLLDPPTAPLTRRPLPRGLHRQRHATVVDLLAEHNAVNLVDLGCGSGALLADFITRLDAGQGDRAAATVLGLDPDQFAVTAAREHLARTLTPDQRNRTTIAKGGVADLENRWTGQDAMVAVEVIEHLDPADLDRLPELVFRELRPAFAVFTTPNADFNAVLPGRHFRHPDHRFEWTRDELAEWAAGWSRVGGYQFSITGVGEPHPDHGSPTQLVQFTRSGPATTNRDGLSYVPPTGTR